MYLYLSWGLFFNPRIIRSLCVMNKCLEIFLQSSCEYGPVWLLYGHSTCSFMISFFKVCWGLFYSPWNGPFWQTFMVTWKDCVVFCYWVEFSLNISQILWVDSAVWDFPFSKINKIHRKVERYNRPEKHREPIQYN